VTGIAPNTTSTTPSERVTRKIPHECSVVVEDSAPQLPGERALCDDQPMDRLARGVALVTGSTSGIGRVIARTFAAEGAAVVVTGRDGERGAAVVAEITAAGGRAAFEAGDLRELEAPARLVDTAVQQFGALTILVNNAVGGGRDAAVADVTDDAWAGILDLDLSAAARLCRAALPALRASGHGAIVNISSRAAERGTPNVAAYTAAKGGLNALTRAIAVEEAEHGVRCNSISAGYVLNDRRDADLADDRRQRLEAMHLTRLGRPEDVAWAAVYLASPEAAFVTGIDLPVDGGSTIARATSFG
jgi:NAD(P)-dependent dehydrogenase (short-subunit alcohol dehydrogenase family)